MNEKANRSKRKKALFITEDAVAIHEDEPFYYVHKYDMRAEYRNGLRNNEFDFKDQNKVTFSDKENAEEWIRMNKKMYSKQDILNLLTEIQK